MEREVKKEHSIADKYLKTCVSFFEAVFLLIPLLFFIKDFVISIPEPLIHLSQTSFLTLPIFYTDFVVCYVLFIIFNFWNLYTNNFYVHLLSIVVCTATSVLITYPMPAIFTVNIYLFCIYLFTSGITFEMSKAIPVQLFGILGFTFFDFFPQLFGLVESGSVFKSYDTIEIIVFSVVLFLTVIFSLIYRYVILEFEDSYESNKHLNVIMTQMSEFNQELQNYAKNKGKEAAEQERLRITRDMHDTCGYVFVNIIGLMEACNSAKSMEFERVKETFETVRSLASYGLKETRSTLRAIRNIENPMETSLDALNEIKRIFQSVTGIKVDLDRGNLHNDYGRTINTVLIRAMQEGLTNAVRHGKATYVSVYLREDTDAVFMTVKDNGNGSKQVVKGIGLAGMEERLQKLGGQLTTSNPPEGGFKLEIKIPLVEI